MFESVPPEPGALRHASDETVVAAIEDWNRLEAEVSARRLDAIAELTSRCCDKEGQRAEWACDGWDEVAGEVAAAMGVNPKKASSQMSLALDLRHRLPEVAALHRAGLVSARVVGAIAWRTRLVGDEALAKIDAALGERAQAWGELSEYKLSQSIDYWVNRHDPDARHRVRENARGRDFHIGRRDDESDTTGMWGRLHAADAAVLKRRLKDMAHSVCDDDPRTMRQRRADAMGALAAGATRLACLCGNPDCPAAGDDGRGSNTVIHVVTEAAALDAQPDPLMSGKGKQPASEPDPPCEKKATPPSGLLLRGGIVPAPLLAELIRCGATVSQVQHPGDAPESGYRPSARLEEFVRVRDMTCRFPGCEEPAEFCDIDHTIPWPVGLTHPSNLKCVCRKHHLLKTFWTGWADVQLPDGTVVWTSPQGKTYRTLPGSRIFFPAWDITTAALPPPTTDPIPATGVMMPKRRRTRTKNRAHHIQKERALNAADRAKHAAIKKDSAIRNKPPPTDTDIDIWNRDTSGDFDDDPPPF